MKSIIQPDKEVCFFCGASTTIRHHIIHGNGFRQVSEREGLWVYICNTHHFYLHNLPSHPHDDELKRLAQRKWLEKKVNEGCTKEQARKLWLQTIGRFYE